MKIILFIVLTVLSQISCRLLQSQVKFQTKNYLQKFHIFQKKNILRNPITYKIIFTQILKQFNKTKNNSTKFKLRCSRYLYTLKIDDQSKAEKIRSSIKPEVKKIEISDKTRNADKKRAAKN